MLPKEHHEAVLSSRSPRHELLLAAEMSRRCGGVFFLSGALPRERAEPIFQTIELEPFGFGVRKVLSPPVVVVSVL